MPDQNVFQRPSLFFRPRVISRLILLTVLVYKIYLNVTPRLYAPCKCNYCISKLIGYIASLTKSKTNPVKESLTLKKADRAYPHNSVTCATFTDLCIAHNNFEIWIGLLYKLLIFWLHRRLFGSGWRPHLFAPTTDNWLDDHKMMAYSSK